MKTHSQLLRTACKWADKAYNEENAGAIKIENKWTSTTAYIINQPDLNIIAFRGTQQLRDWLFNLSAIPVPYAGRLCHSGFVAAHASVWGKIKKHIDFDKPTLLCGHSLGGALSEISAAKLHKKHKKLSVITFGKPNTFFKGFKRPMNLKNQVSVVSGSDLVARIPRLCYGPSVSQSIIFHANNGDDFVDPPSELKRRDFMNAKKEAISDHFMPGYKERLNLYLKRKKK
tara:strand:- start:2885 stop:3571 length:687 start_codon:yes stop_codon:yes gene_type:complete